MISLAIQQFLARWQRSLAVFIAVVLGVAFFAIALLAGGPLNQNLRVGVGQQIHGSDLIVTMDSGEWVGNEPETVQDLDFVEAADWASFTTMEMNTGGTQTYVSISNVPEVPAVRAEIELIEGSWPTSNSEIALAESTMNQAALIPGDSVTVSHWDTAETTSYTIVGVFESPSGLAFGRANAMVTPAAYESLATFPNRYGVRIQLAPDSEIVSSESKIESILGNGYRVQTFDEFVDDEVQDFAGQTVALQVALGAFAFIAMVASGLVIANSFEISLAQRVREIGLLRSIGATNRQIRLMVLVEALVIGVVASVIGVGLGTFLMIGAASIWWAESGSNGVDVQTISVIVPITLGVFATLLAAYGPARGAMRIHPLQAIRQSDAPVMAVRESRFRTVAAGAMAVSGIGIMAIAVMWALNGGASSGLPTLIGIVGGALSFFAVLISSQLIVPKVASGFGKIAGKLFGVTGELATGNLERNPKRTASAAAALLLGVTLMTMMTVGSASVRSSIVSEVQDREPIDLQIRVTDPSVDSATTAREIERWKSLEGVDRVATLSVKDLEFGDAGAMPVVGVTPGEANAVLRGEGLSELSDSTIIVTSDFAFAFGLVDGGSVEVSGSERSSTFQVLVRRSGVSEPVMTMQSLQNLSGASEASGVWIRLESGTSVGTFMSNVRAGLPPNTTLTVDGGAEERESILEILETMLLVVLGLLAAAVVIAVVGIGNTLTLSVVERTRESGMLRAMGLKRRQVRAMLALEGVAISLVGALIGIVLGIAFGLTGVLTLFGDTLGVSFAIPWGQLALICLVAIVCGLLASVLPARKALSIQPVEALSTIS